MEHLLLPEGVSHYITALYAVDEADYYDGKGYFDYPRRSGYSDRQIQGLDKFDQKPEQVQNFFHTWLYFGVAIELFNAVGVPITTSTLLRTGNNGPYKFVDTEILPNLFKMWKAKVEKDGQDSRPAAFDEIMYHAREVLNRFCTRRPSAQVAIADQQTPWPVSDEISTTILALYLWFEAQATTIYDATLKTPGNTATSILLRRRLERKWCKYDVAVILDDFQVDGLYYLGAAPSPSQEYLDDHRDCTEDGCAYSKESNAYVTKHAKECHRPDCNFNMKYGGHLGPERPFAPSWVEGICGVIDRGAIPLILWPRMRDCWTVEYHLTGKRQPKYVAISHVWSDGMGNPFQNALPECQLERIQKLVNELGIGDGRNDTQWWMDTICVPVGDPLRDYKKKAIRNMRLTYQRASAALVLDAWMQEIPSTVPVPVLITRFYQSNWLRRLWTHQEGFLPETVYIRFKDKAVTMSEIWDRVSKWAGQEKAKGNIANFINDAVMACTLPYTFLKNVITNYGQATELQERIKPSLFAPLIASVELRRTTKASDEMLCLASVLNLDIKKYTNISSDDDDKDAEQRMIHFYKTTGTFDGDLIFNRVERLQAPGFRWAPKSLIGQRVYKFFPRLSTSLDERPMATLQGDGTSGLLVRYSGITFRFYDKDSLSIASTKRKFLLSTSTGGLHGKSWFYSVSVLPNHVSWERNVDYAMIASQSVNSDGLRIAIIGITNFANGKNTFSHLCHAYMHQEDALALGDLDKVIGGEHPETTEWLLF